MGLIKCAAPINVQFEVTYKCNNSCSFCYNPCIHTLEELNTQEAIRIIHEMVSFGVLSINFNGGEPLIRKDFFELAKAASDCGLDIHMNTNATLIDADKAKRISLYFGSVCTTILSNDANIHDELSGRTSALKYAITGIENLQNAGVYVAVNIMLSRANINNLESTLRLLEKMCIRTVLITRFVPCSHRDLELHLEESEFWTAIKIIKSYNDIHTCFDRIAFPQPYKICDAPKDIQQIISNYNIACNIGLCTASISPNGYLYPCNLVHGLPLGNLREESFEEAWNNFDGMEYCQNVHLQPKCIECSWLESCGGGCKGFNDAMRNWKENTWTTVI